MARLGIPAVLIGLFTWLLWEDRLGAALFTTLTGGALVVGLALQFGGRLREIDIKGTTPRRIVAKVEHHRGELFPRVGFIVTNMVLPSRSVVRFYNKRGTAEQWIKEGKQGTHWTRLSCHRFRANEVRLQLSVLAYNLGNLWRRLVLPPRIKRWSLTSLQHRLVKTGGRLVKHARYYWLLLAEGHLTRRLFGDMLRRIWALPVPGG